MQKSCSILAAAITELENNKMALKWFRQASLIKPGWVNPLYGTSLIYLKLGMSEESIEYNEKALRWYNINEITKINLLYMRAYWLKILNNYSQSADIYKELLEKAEKFEFQAMQKLLWDSVLTMIEYDQSFATEIKIQLQSNILYYIFYRYPSSKWWGFIWRATSLLQSRSK